MQINNQNSTNFMGIQSKVLKNINNLPASYRKNIAKYKKILEKSDVVDLTYNNSGEIVLKTKDMIKVGPMNYLGEGVELSLTPISQTVQRGSKIECTDVQIRQKEDITINLILDLGSDKLAEGIMKNFKFIDGYYPDKLPILGALLDISERMSAPLETLRQCAKELGKTL